MKPFCDTGHAVPIQQWKTSMLVLLHPTNVYTCKRLGFPRNNCVYCQHSIIASPPRALLRVCIPPSPQQQQQQHLVLPQQSVSPCLSPLLTHVRNRVFRGTIIRLYERRRRGIFLLCVIVIFGCWRQCPSIVGIAGTGQSQKDKGKQEFPKVQDKVIGCLSFLGQGAGEWGASTSGGRRCTAIVAHVGHVEIQFAILLLCCGIVVVV